jgi:very-short-patch-repair endonuclease
MAYKSAQRTHPRLWALVARQHGVVTRTQLLELGYSQQAIAHRLARGRLHAVRRGVYAVGRPELTAEGRWLAAVLACGPGAALSYGSAAALWGLSPRAEGVPEVTVPSGRSVRRPGIVVHRRAVRPEEVVVRRGIPVTSPICTLVDIAVRLGASRLEAAVNEADKLDLAHPEALRAALEAMPRRPGVAALRRTLDRRTFTLTDSALERRVLPIARRAGLPRPRTRQLLNGFRVDFHWPDLGLVVETDGLRYHRTAAQQERDRVRDQVHSAAGLTCLRFTRAQVTFEPDHVERVLGAVGRRLGGDRPG